MFTPMRPARPGACWRPPSRPCPSILLRPGTGCCARSAAGIAAALLLSVTVAGATPALAAVTSALSRAAADSFRMNLIVTEHLTVPGQLGIPSPLHIGGELDLKRNLGEEKLSNGWRTLIVGGEAYTELPPPQAKMNGGKP